MNTPTNRASVGGVSSLRAKFEQAQQTNTPDGPGRSSATATNGDSARPLSKVRTSFVPVGPSHSAESVDRQQDDMPTAGALADLTKAKITPAKTNGTKKEALESSTSVEEAPATTPPPAQVMQNLASNFSTPSRPPKTVAQSNDRNGKPTVSPSDGMTEPLPLKTSPKIPVTPSSSTKAPKTPTSGPPSKEPASANDTDLPSWKEETFESIFGNEHQAQPEFESIFRNEYQEQPEATSCEKETTFLAARLPLLGGASYEESNTSRVPPAQAGVSVSSVVADGPPSTVPSRQASADRKNNKAMSRPSNPTAGARRVPIRRLASQTQTNGETGSKPKAKTCETAPPTSMATSSRARPTQQTTNGFVKPKPKSPTRPIKLPSHLTAPTASSAAKFGQEAAQKKALSNRRSSAVSERSAPLRRSAVRSSIGPPPRQASVRPTPASRTTPKSPRTSTAPKAPAPSFLERMMRPTASSASKVHAKTGDSPAKGR